MPLTLLVLLEVVLGSITSTSTLLVEVVLRLVLVLLELLARKLSRSRKYLVVS